MAGAAAFVDALFSLKGKPSETPAQAQVAQAAIQARRALTGMERASILLLALGEKHGAGVWKLLDDDEIRSLAISQRLTELMGGRIDFYFLPLAPALPLVKEGQLIALAVSTDTRAIALPDVPTAAEAGVTNYESSAWLALLAPAGTDKAIIDKLYAAVQEAMKDPKVLALFAEQGAEPAVLAPDALKEFMASETTKWSAIIGKLGIEPM